MGVVELAKRVWANEYFRLCFIAAGIMLGFLVFGVMQEKITRKSCFGGTVDEETKKCEGGEKFKYEMVLVLCLTFWYSILARVLLAVPQLNKGEKDLTHFGWYFAAAFTYLSAMVCGTMALRWISYPTQVIAKSSKPIPVMILGVLLAHKRYTIQKYFFVLLIVIGVVMFIYDGDKAASKKGGDENNHLGLMLIGLSLLADGVLGAIEDRMRAKTKPTALNFMFKINAFAALLLLIGTVATGEMKEFFEFAYKYPDLYGKIALAALAGSMGQIFIFMMISEFGPLPCSITTTLRKFFTVIISVIFMGNPLNTQQQIATAIVFAALFADALWGKKQLCGKPRAEQVPTEEPDVEKNAPEKTETELQTLNGKDKQ